MFRYSDSALAPLPTERPRAIIRSLVSSSRSHIGLGVFFRSIQEVVAALSPVFLGVALDAGLENGVTAGIWIAAGWLALFAFLQGLMMALGHGSEVAVWIRSAFRSITQVHTHVTRTGTAIRREKSTGEVVATGMSDANHVANLLETLPRLIGGLVAFVVVAIVLLGQNIVLGLVVLIGVPIITALVGLLVKPLQTLQAAQREEQGKLTSLATDTVAGLRVLRGIGGEHQFNQRYAAQSQKVRQAGNAVARLQSWIDGLQFLIPGLFTAFVMYMGAHLALNGNLTIGQFAALFGLTTYLARPLQMAMMSIAMFSRARVGARKIFNILRIQPIAGSLDERVHDTHREDAGKETLAHHNLDELFVGTIVDRTTGVRIFPGMMTAIVSARPEDSAALIERIARVDDEVADVTASGVDIRTLPIMDVRRNILYSPATPELFGGRLRTVIDAYTYYPADDSSLIASREKALGEQTTEHVKHDNQRDIDILTALDHADGHDVLSSLEHSLDGEVTEKARSLSGGQRQRVALARSLMPEAPVLLLVEPTSAVDSHTEDRIIQRLKERRNGKTTVITSASPLILDHVDDVIFLTDTEVARGRHHDLLARAAQGDPHAQAYEAVVSRSTGEDQ